MGIAAYNRGSRAIAAQFDMESASRPDRFTGLSNRIDHLEAKLAQSQKDLAAEIAEMNRARACIARLRATLTVEREEYAATDALHKQQITMLRESRRMLEHSWRKASAMIRACLSPEQVEVYRAERDRRVVAE